MAAVMRILSYLKGAPGKLLIFKKHRHLEIKGYIDADWAGNITDRRSTSGYFTFVGGNLVTWRSKKQNVVARSTAEVEYCGMAHGVCELLWLRILLTEIRYGALETYIHDRVIYLSFENRIAVPSLSSGMLPFNSALNALTTWAYCLHNLYIDCKFCNQKVIIPPVVSWADVVSIVAMTTMHHLASFGDKKSMKKFLLF
nr:uncharacterized protein LOC114825095 [Malus domestica]